MISARCAAIPLAVLVALVAAPGAAAGLPGEWTKIGDPGGTVPSSSLEADLARDAEGRLYILWAGGAKVLNTRLSASLKGRQRTSVVVTYEGGAVNENVALVRTGDGFRAFFAGLYPGSQLDVALATATSADGVTWAVQPTPASDGRPGQKARVYEAAGIGATASPTGTPFAVWGDSGPAGFHIGTNFMDGDLRFRASEDGLVSEVNIASEARVGEGRVSPPTLVWNDIADGAIFVASVSAPDESVPVPFADAPDGAQQIAITGRIPGRAGSSNGDGVYVAYLRGTNVFLSRPAIWRIGSDSPMTLSNAPGARYVNVAAAPNGRIWAFWARTDPLRIYATRSNTKATKFGPISNHSPPAKATSIFSLKGDGSLGPLDLLALVQPPDRDHPDNYHQQILPRLKLLANGGNNSAVFRVLDAGQDVNKAKVTVAGETKLTGSDGRAFFSGLPEGTRTATARQQGYAKAKQQVTIE